MLRNISILKEGGEKEAFDPRKLLTSLQRAGGSKKIAEQITTEIRHTLPREVSTEEIYKRAFALLKKQEKPTAARYSMKRALLELGPSGFPFEDFVSEIFRAKGYAVETGKILPGACVEHEVDIIASNEKTLAVGEIKFHNDLGMKSDLKVALYVKARLEDLQKFRMNRGERAITEGWLITNTKFTKAALQYANCTGLKAISWTYPRYGNLQDLIEETKLHPITCLTTLSRGEKTALMQKGVVLCRSIAENQNALSGVGIQGLKLRRALEEGKLLCSIE